MKGFKDSTKTMYYKGGSTSGAKGAAKVARVMHEFKTGTLHSGSKKGPEVKNRKQAVAIALNEARRSLDKAPMRKAEGGQVKVPDRLYRGDAEKNNPPPLVKRKAVPPVNREPKIPPKMPEKDRRIVETPSRPFKKGGYAC